MKAWMRYGIVAAFAVWLLGLAPAFVFMPHYRNHEGRSVSYAMYYAFAPFFVTITLLIAYGVTLSYPDFAAWLRGRPNETELARLRRIEELEREVGIR